MKLWVLLILAGCNHSEGPRRGPFPVGLTAQLPAEDPVVATVDGREIHTSQVATQAAARGTDARQALSDLIDAEVLAGEAVRRGLDRDRDAEEAAQATAVRRLLSQSFESEVTPAQIPETVLRKVYEKNRPLIDHAVEIDVWHILVATDAKMTPEEKQQAGAAAEELARRARGVHGVPEFKALAATVKSARPTRAEHVVTEKDGWTRKEFSYAAFEQLHKPGDTSSVIETPYGYHVLYLVGFVPARHTSFAEAEPELRKGVFPEFQKPELIHWLDTLAGSHTVEIHPERIK